MYRCAVKIRAGPDRGIGDGPAWRQTKTARHDLYLNHATRTQPTTPRRARYLGMARHRHSDLHIASRTNGSTDPKAQPSLPPWVYGSHTEWDTEAGSRVSDKRILLQIRRRYSSLMGVAAAPDHVGPDVAPWVLALVNVTRCRLKL